MSNSQPIGVFDSGLGGLSVYKEIRRQLPNESILYFADQGRLPYGPRPAPEVRQYSEQITRFLIAQHAKLIVVACNTASAAALAHLRQTFGHLPIVGMEPAVKPAAKQSKSKVVGVIATEATCQSEVFASVVERFATGVTVLTQACPGLVTQVENGELDSEATIDMLHTYLDPLLAQGIDSLVLACTHYSFLLPAIRRIVPPTISIIDPAPAIARQVRRVLEARQLGNAPGAPSAVSSYSTAVHPTRPELITLLTDELMPFQSIAISQLEL